MGLELMILTDMMTGAEIQSLKLNPLRCPIIGHLLLYPVFYF